MREAIGGTDDESLEGVAPVETGAAGGRGRVVAVGTFSEVVGPVLFDADRVTVFVGLVGVT